MHSWARSVSLSLFRPLLRRMVIGVSPIFKPFLVDGSVLSGSGYVDFIERFKAGLK